MSTSARPITKILVANRGEIACRVFRTARDMGIRTVAVYCDAERNGKHVQMADEAFRLGPPPAKTSYLVAEKVIEVAKKSGATAIHPGYGFLSENAEFADLVARENLTFIGPPAKAIISMGSKSESKNIMTAANVPVIPGYHGENQDEAHLLKVAKEIGFPILIKAVSGGGGKGMKIVGTEAEFSTLLQSAKREAMNFFKDDRVLLERYVERPRHIECQIFCDMHGNGVFFFERDCSVQRRFQKVMEEAPAPLLTQELREAIGDVAVRAAKAVGYVGAGTVEFIFDTQTNKFYFMEMNTRLQVEHPVTEEAVFVQGKPLDLVRLQIETAEGKPLSFTQKDITINGHCIETRIFAESPREGFLPGSGHLSYVSEPNVGRFGNTKVRLDTGFRSGDDVLVHYDPMIAKLIVWAPTRLEAIKGMSRALAEYHIVGVQTNIDFLKECMMAPQYIAGGVTTRFIEENKERLLAIRPVPSEITAVAALAYVFAKTPGCEAAFRLNCESIITVPFTGPDGKTLSAVSVQVLPDGSYLVIGDGFKHVLSRCPALCPEMLAVHVDNAKRLECKTVVTKERVAVMHTDGCSTFKLLPLKRGFGNIHQVKGNASTVNSPMPGKVSKLVAPSQSQVTAGQTILIMEAMKMEHLVKSPCDGKVTFRVAEGEMVAADQELASFEVAKDA